MATFIDKYPQNFTSTVSSNTVITYQELKNDFVNWIKTVAANLNIDNIGAQFKSGYSAETEHVGVGWTTINIASGSPVVQAVTQSEIENEVNAFMSARGIDTKSYKPVTTKGIIQFWNYAAIFCAARFSRYYSSMTKSTPLVYNKGTVEYDNADITDDNNYITNTDVTNALKRLMNTIAKHAKIKAMLYEYKAHCCCCSSSSCSSSSSSMFIGYMKIPT